MRKQPTQTSNTIDYERYEAAVAQLVKKTKSGEIRWKPIEYPEYEYPVYVTRVSGTEFYFSGDSLWSDPGEAFPREIDLADLSQAINGRAAEDALQNLGV